MTDDRLRPSRIQAEQDRGIGDYLRHQVVPYSPFYRTGLGDPGRVRRAADLAVLPTTSLAEVDDPAALVLRPDPERVLAQGELGLRVTMRVASLLGRAAATANSRIDPLYKPLHWIVTDTPERLPIGYAAPDLDRLAELGRRWLEQAGVRQQDVLVSILPAGPDLAFWQLQLGARRGGVSALLLDGVPAPDELVRLQPTVLAGRPDQLVGVLSQLAAAALELPGLATVLTAGQPLDDRSRRRLAELAAAVSSSEPCVVAAWAPPGVRAVWAECRGGAAFHTWPDSEVIEVVDGEVVWTALGWRGSVLVRLRTGALGTLEAGTCPSCGRTTPRLTVSVTGTGTGTESGSGTETGTEPELVSVLDGQRAFGGWQAELDGDELVVFVAPANGNDPADLEPAMRAVDGRLGVTQFVVLDEGGLAARLAESGDNRVVDRRDPANR